MKKVLTIFGTRPEGIKMAPIIHELERHSDMALVNVITGQHREMLHQVMEIFSLKADYDLDIMKSEQTLTGITTAALRGLEPILAKEKPDAVLVQGDTSTAFVGGLAAFYQKIPVGHIEAGLRTEHRYDPFPEEINRRLLSSLANFHYAPTAMAKENLLRDGFAPEDIFVTGNSVTDALMSMAERLPEGWPEELVPEDFRSDKVILVEAHRRENLGEPMEQLCLALKEILKQVPEARVIFSVHRNPKVREVVFPALEGHPGVLLLEPVDYTVLIRLIRQSYLIITDSGGIQEEAPSLAKPVLVARNTTERPEGVDAGVARLVGMSYEAIVKNALELLQDKEVYHKMSLLSNPYGDGRAAKRIVEALRYSLGLGEARPVDFGEGAS